MMQACTAVARIFAAAALMALAGSVTAQQAYPIKPIRIIVTTGPGGSIDPLARLVGQKLIESWGQQVIVDNRPGGNGVIGHEALVKSLPDGYTILVVTSTHVISPILFPSLPYDSFKDFAPVATLVKSEFVLVVHPSAPANNLKEFIALAKSKPGQLNYSSGGTGTPNHLAGELFNTMAGVKMQHVPYKSGGQSIADLIGGQVQLYFSATAQSIPYIKSGKLKAIAISGETRSPALSQVPTFTEAGLPGFEIGFWYGVLAPASTPKPIIEKLSAELGTILTRADFREKLGSLGVNPFISTPEQFGTTMKADFAKYSKIIKTANIKAD